MKASSLKRKERTIEQIYESIKLNNDNGMYKYLIPHFEYVSENTKLQLIKDGFKVYIGDWDNVMINSLIIEW